MAMVEAQNVPVQQDVRLTNGLPDLECRDGAQVQGTSNGEGHGGEEEEEERGGGKALTAKPAVKKEPDPPVPCSMGDVAIAQNPATPSALLSEVASACASGIQAKAASTNGKQVKKEALEEVDFKNLERAEGKKAKKGSVPSKVKVKKKVEADVAVEQLEKKPKGRVAKAQPAAVVKTGKGEAKRRKAEEPVRSKVKKPKTEDLGQPAEAEPKKEGTKGRKAKQEVEHEVWRWWEEEKKDESIKWKFLEHKGPVFAPEYEPLPEHVKFYYDGNPVKLSLDAEEVATFYGKMLDHEYTTKDVFNKNFFHDWRKVMSPSEREFITDLKKCNFREICDYFVKKTEERKAMTKEEKQLLKEEQERVRLEYGVAVIDGHKEKIGNFKVEPPNLFRGRGVHPKMGKLKRRIQPEDVIINCSKDSKIPEPPAGHKWKEVRHDNTVTWLASWTENIMGSNKYVMLNPSSKIKGEKDWEKYEIARKLKDVVDEIRANYRQDWKSKETKIRQRAVALYFIDKLALRAGHEKEENETADTVGCCSLRCEHIKLHEELGGQQFVVEFDFPGKDSIRYYNRVPVERRVFKNLKIFMENKSGEDELFDRLSTSGLNKHLQSLMDGLTAKVFRTFNASVTLQEQLNLLSKGDMNAAEKLLAYNRANRQVAILCNHQRSVPKAHGQQMENMQKKIEEKEKQVKEAKKAAKAAKAEHKTVGTGKTKRVMEQKERAVKRLEEQLLKLKVKATDKEENKEIALSTSKLNYLDPRITVAWCRKMDVPIDKVYNKTQREKFRWAIDMAGPDFVF